MSSRKLVLFKQVPILSTFILHGVNRPRRWFKVTSTQATLVEGTTLGKRHTINPDVLVFTEGISDGEVFATGNASKLVGS